MGIVEGGGEVKAIYPLFVGVGLNSSGLLLQEEDRLVVGFSGGEVTSRGMAGLELCMGLQLTDLKLFVRGMHARCY